MKKRETFLYSRRKYEEDTPENVAQSRTAGLHATVAFFASDIRNPSVIFFTRANCCLLHFKTSPFLRGSLPSDNYITSKLEL